jgi:hypothetical protein
MIELVKEEDVVISAKRQQLIKRLQHWVKINNRIPKAFDLYDNPDYPSFKTYSNEFGTWNNALIAAGIGIRQKEKLYSREQLIVDLQQCSITLGRTPKLWDLTYNPVYASFKTYINEFGSWNNVLIEAGLKINKEGTYIRARTGELQTISETEGAIDLAGEYCNSSCDGICSEGLFDTKSASLQNRGGMIGWPFSVTITQLEEAKYLVLRAYKDKDFSKQPLYKWKIPIEFMDNGTTIFIHKYKRRSDIKHYVENMKEYEFK